MGTSQQPPEDRTPHPAERENNPSSAVARLGAASAGVSQRNESSSTMLAARARAEIEASMLVAKQWPRDIDQFRDVMLKTCERPIFADQAMYAKPTGKDKQGKETFATGLSIRFAEEAARTIGNIDVSVLVVAEDDESRTLEATCTDLETNVRYRAQAKFAKYVERRSPRNGEEIVGSRTNSRGDTVYKIRASDDQVFMEHQRNAAKASREATLKLIPAWVKEECEERIERTMKAVDGNPEAFRAKLIVTFDKIGISIAALEKFLGKTLASADLSELKLLRRAFNAVSQGETTWAEIAGAKDAEATTAEGEAKADGKGSATLRAKVAQKANAVKPATPTDQAAEDLAEDRRIAAAEEAQS